MVKDSVLSCNVKKFQSGRTVGTHDKIGKKTSDFCVKPLPKLSECQTMNALNKHSPRNPQINTVVTKESHQDIMTKQVTETDVVGNSVGDKYCLDLQMKLKGEKIRVAKRAIQNERFVTQNTPMFGFIPIYGLKGRVYDRHENNICQNIMELHQKLRNDGRPNYVGLQIPVSSKLNPEKWEKYLQNYWDWQLPLLNKYGFPIDFDRNAKICHDLGNHNSANQYPDHVLHYLQEEIQYGAIVGPFKVSPIDKLHVSPFMTRDKSSSEHRRVIIDLSWPLGHQVWNYIDDFLCVSLPSKI